MNFVERLFHISPDGGNGSFEALLIVMASLAVAILIFRRPLRRFIFSLLDRLAGIEHRSK